MKKNKAVQLEKENIMLCKRIDELEAELSRLRAEAFLGKRGDKKKTFAAETGSDRVLGAGSYPAYLFRLIKSTSLWAVFGKWAVRFRRFRLFSTALRIITKIVILAESGVAFVALFSAMVVILPFVLILSAASLLVAMIRSRSANRFFAEKLKDKKVYILFAGKKQLSKNGRSRSFFDVNARDLADENSVCFIVSPYFFSRKGLGKRDFYVTARFEDENLYIVRKSYFFMLRRKVINRVALDIITVY